MAANTTERELVELEDRYWQALKDGDVDSALGLTDDPCILTGPQGALRVDKQNLAGMLKSPRYKLDAYELGDIQVRFIGDDVAITAYEAHEELTVEGEPITLDAIESSTWVRRDGTWLCAMHSEAVAGDPFGRDRTRTG